MAALRFGKFKDKTVTEVLKEQGGMAYIEFYLKKIEQGFSDPKWGAGNKKHYQEIRDEMNSFDGTQETNDVQKPNVSVSGDGKVIELLIEIKGMVEALVKKQAFDDAWED